jgi:two-component system sensor histidine kinase GlrK
VRLTIFWRIVLAQVFLMALIVCVSVYTLSQLHQLSELSQGMLTIDAATVKEEKHLLRLLLAQMRSAEKFVLLQDKAFYGQFLSGSQGVEASLETLRPLVTSAQERDLLRQIGDLYAQYTASLVPEATRRPVVSGDRAELSERLTTGVHALIQRREEAMALKAAAARDRSALAARVVGWLTCGTLTLAVLLAYLQARSVSRPLRTLAQELRLVGKGVFQRYVDIRSPAEIGELVRAFNWMASRLAKLDELKEDFIAHVSHELRTPFAAIREGTTLLWEEIPGPLTASQREVINVVRSHSERLYRFLSSVLDVSKMEAGMMEYLRRPTDLSALLERSAQTVRLSAQRKGIRLEVLYPSVLPQLVLDEERMQQVLDNLLNNAVKFTPAGGIVRVAAAPKDKLRDRAGDCWVEVRVSDTGVGIPAEEIDRVFDKFYQSPHHQSQRERGTGLGLAIARHIVAAHGGRLWVESQLAKGSTFILLLPAPDDVPEQLSPVQVPIAAGADAAPGRD